MTIGCAANNENTTAPRTEARRVSLTPYSVPILWNMSNEKARAGKMLDWSQATKLIPQEADTKQKHKEQREGSHKLAYLAKYMYTVAGTTL